MLSTVLVDLLKEVLKETFPKFAYWLFYSEMAVTLLIGVLLCFAWPVGTLVSPLFFCYAALCWIGACNYTKKRKAEENLSWTPSAFDRGVAVFMSLGLLVFGVGVILASLDGAWMLAVLGAIFLLAGGLNIKRVLSGKWVTFP
jgi:hypothetical protein